MEEVKNSDAKKEMTVHWPSGGPIPINEFGSTKIFAQAYPWLFPGGVGDVKDHPSEHASDWG